MYINGNAFDLLGEYSVNEDNSKDISHIMNKTAFHIRVLTKCEQKWTFQLLSPLCYNSRSASSPTQRKRRNERAARRADDERLERRRLGVTKCILQLTNLINSRFCAAQNDKK